ncbi:MAG: hypothetical protein Tp118SUR00d2C21406231_45 [Prokaryotic dsDNA virus sp.]|nr:MAG: hypothetical protein Tp125DCM00d2C40298531_64 [Prokaryotic dsDNA virus sp.]QDP53165.1 MAG: hypothetical protein Tp118SUR00d2C21406231_45 [Prokaryotic dsDNA virus sp.]
MSISVNMHHVADMKTYSVTGKDTKTEWIEIIDRDGNTFNIFMPIDLASAISDVFTAHKVTEAAQ